MLNRIALAAAPLALLAACGGGQDEEAVPADGGETGSAGEAGTAAAGTAGAATAASGMAGADMPPVAGNALDTVDYTGTYALEGPGGARSTVQLHREDNSYTYRDSTGGQRSGTFRRVDSNRIAIDDFDGRTAYFSVADGALYRLHDEATPYDQVTVEGMYRREDGPVQEIGPGATTDIVADERG